MKHHAMQGRIQDLPIEGAQKIICAQHTSQAQKAKSLMSGVQSLLKEALGFLDALSHAIWILYWSIMIQNRY